jgi:hypothetical protein
VNSLAIFDNCTEISNRGVPNELELLYHSILAMEHSGSGLTASFIRI